MEKDVLAAIMEVEREIEGELAAERKQGEARLEQVKREIAERLEQEERRLAGWLQRELAAAGEAAQREARICEEKIAAGAERLARLDDDTLQRAVARHLTRIVPGHNHDRQDGNG
jgi:hypothetical protein